MNRLAINNPKQLSNNEVKVNWYNYYAGFSDSFVKDVLLSSKLKKTDIVLDPWNGAGTTTASVSDAGYNAIGVDLNPAMCIVAKAKSASMHDMESAYNKTKNLRVDKFNVVLTGDDFLLNWFEYDTAKYIRYLSKAIIQLSMKENVTFLTVDRCVMLVALFNIVRDMVQSFVPSNPTWIKKAKNESEKIKAINKKIKTEMLCYIHNIKQGISVNAREPRGSVNLIAASSTSLPIETEVIDLIITSPPYCTRIDYGVATYPELAVLFGDNPDVINRLRRQLIGRTTIDKESVDCEIISHEARRFMQAVEQHVSHASSNYYLKNFKQYFIDMQISISEISRVIKKTGNFICVVQDSYYKEIYCDLSGIITEIAAKNGFSLIDKIDFKAKAVMANIHSGTRKYRSKVTATESVLFYTKNKEK